MENAELEKWVREQTERLGELRRLLCSSGKPELEQYLAQAVVQPFFYYRKNGNGNGGSRVTLALEKFVDEEKFKALLTKMNIVKGTELVAYEDSGRLVYELLTTIRRR